MAAVNRNMFEASVTTDRPQGAPLMILPLNLIAVIVSYVRLATALMDGACAIH